MSEEQTAEAKQPDELPEFLEIEAGGKTWRLGRIGFDFRLAAEEEIRLQRRIEFRHVIESLAGLPERDRSTVTVAALDQLVRNIAVPIHEVHAWMDGPSGQQFLLHWSLKRGNPGVTREQTVEMMAALNAQQMADISRFLFLKILG